MGYTVVFAPDAVEQLAALYDYVAVAASPEIAGRYVDAIVAHCEDMQNFPLRGTRRDDIRPGLRITNYKKGVAIAFAVDAWRLSILGVFYGGRNYEAALQPDRSEFRDP